MSLPAAKPLPSYFVVAIQYPRRILPNGTIVAAGVEAVVDPEITRRDVISRLISREYDDVLFVHHVIGMNVHDVTLELQMEASVMSEAA